MAGLLRPYGLHPRDIGHLEYEGQRLQDDPARHRELVAYGGHQDSVKAVLTVGEDTRFWAGLHGQAGKAQAAIDAMGLAVLAETPGRFLSSGQRRRTALARVIASGAAVWLLDEPTVGLDAKSIAALEAALAAHRSGGGIVVAATHTPIDLPGAGTLDLADFQPLDFADEADAA
jgi:heme exporter protein A